MSEPILEIGIFDFRARLRRLIAEHCITELDWRFPKWDRYGGATPIATCMCGYSLPIDEFYKHQAEAIVKDSLRRWWR